MAVLKEENESLRKLVVEKELENQALREFIKKTSLERCGDVLEGVRFASQDHL